VEAYWGNAKSTPNPETFLAPPRGSDSDMQRANHFFPDNVAIVHFYDKN
jgi:hypothetical protein